MATAAAPPPQQQLDSTLPVLPDDCIYEVFQHLSAKDLANASKTCRSWNKLSEKNSLWQQLCLERWRTWAPPPPFSSYYDEQRDYNGVLLRSFDGMSLHHNQQQQRHYGSSNSQEDNYYKRKGGSSSTSSFSKYPPPLEKIPDMHLPSQWYSTSHPPYDLESWKHVYRERDDKDHIIRMLLDEMVEDSRNRMRHMDGIAGIGMGLARDVLENIIHGRNGEIKDLSRTFYAQKTLKRLQRGWVLDQWRGYRSGYQGFPVWQGCGLMAMFSDQTMELADLDRQFQELADEFLALSPPIPAGGVGSTGGSLYSEDHLDGVDSFSTAATPPVYVGGNNHYPTGIDRYSPGSLLDSSSSSSSGRIASPLLGGSAAAAASNKATMASDRDRMQERIDETHEQYQRHYDAQVERMKDLIRFFTREKGFKGNTENYYDPFNSLIDKVLTRKVGIPISLCIVFAELAERVGVHGVELMGFPQHFMIRYHPLPPRGSHHGSPMLGHDGGVGGGSSLLAPPIFFLDLFHPPHRLLSTYEYEDYFTSLNIPRPPNVYRDLPTPPLEIFLRCLRNIILAVEQTGGAGRIGSDHQTSLYSGITQLLALHPIEEWGLYVLWLKYLGNFWPEDVGFVRTAIEDMELSDHRRTVGRRSGMAASPPPQQLNQRPHHTYVRGRGGLHAAAGSAGQYTASLSTQETVKILRAHVRELEMADEAGDVGEIRRRRRPKVVATSNSPLVGSSSSMSSPDPLLSSVDHHHPGQRGTSSSVLAEGVAGTVAGAGSTASASSPTMDSHASHAHHQYLRQNSISGEQQNGSSSSMNPVPMSSLSVDDEIIDRPRVATVFGGEERRRPEPEYYVGEVFRHLMYRYTGVIYGYDLKCEAEEGWIRSMGIDMLSHGRHQPFYNALLNDGSKRYVAQENIQVLFREYRQGGGGAGAGGGRGHGVAADQIPLDLAAMLSAAGATVVPLIGSVPVAGVGFEEGNVVEELSSSSSGTSQTTAPAAAAVTEGEATTGEESADTMAIDPATDSTAAPTAPAPAIATGPGPGPTGTTATTPASILSNMTFSVYNVEFSELGPLDIEAVGQYFEAWDNKHGHYVMNKELRKVYPTEDYL